MKTLLLPVLLSLALASGLSAQNCREVVRDSSGRIVQTIERQKQAGGTERAVTRDASGRITGTATTRPNAGGSARTEYRDASGRITGTTTANPAGTVTGIRRDASGRVTGTSSGTGKCHQPAPLPPSNTTR